MTRKRQIARVTTLVVLGLALLSLGVLSVIRRSDSLEPSPGVSWVQSSSGPIALQVAPDSAPWEAGLRAGDLLIAVDGEATPSALEAAQIVWEKDPGTVIELRVRRGSEQRVLQVTSEWAPRTEPYTYLVIVGLAFWVSGMFLAVRWPTIRGGVPYSLLALAMFARLTLSHTGQADALDWTIYWGDTLAGLLVPPFLLHLGVTMARRSLKRPRVLLNVAYLLSGAGLAVAVWLSPGALGGALRFDDPVLALELIDRVEPLFLALSYLVTVVLLARAFSRSASALQRSQHRWMLWGLSVGLGPFVFLYAVPWSVGAAELPIWAQFASVVPMLLVPVVLTAALARYRLHDLDLMVLRGFAEVTAVFCAFGVYAVSVRFLREGVSEFLPMSNSAPRYIGLLVMAVTYPQLRAWALAGVEKAFYRKRYSYRATLLDWARELNADTDLQSLLRRLKERIRETLGVPRAEVLIRSAEDRFSEVTEEATIERLQLDQGSLERLGDSSYVALAGDAPEELPWADYLFPMMVNGRLRAVMAIADRDRPEEPLNREDRALLGTLAAHAATGIEAARLVAEVRQRAEEIERLHARQAKILESSAVGLLLLDGEGRIQAWNRALEGIYGVSRDEAIGCGLADLFPLHVARRIEQVREARSGEGSRYFRLSMVNRDGQRLVANLAISPVDGEGAPDGAMVVTFDDVSERVKLEEQVLQQERLASLGLLAAGVAHEINTPLTGISSYAQMLHEEAGTDTRRRDILKKIEDQTRRASQITSSLLNLANPERTALEMLDINAAIREVVQLFQPQVRGRGVELEVELSDGLPRLQGQKAKLQQVLLNLLLNARDASGPGGVITLTSAVADDRIMVCVTDTGKGISEEDLPQIFDPFFTTKGRGQGTGLGLSISYGIIHEHGGEIQVDSRPGEFTRFRIELPAAGTSRAMVGS